MRDLKKQWTSLSQLRRIWRLLLPQNSYNHRPHTENYGTEPDADETGKKFRRRILVTSVMRDGFTWYCLLISFCSALAVPIGILLEDRAEKRAAAENQQYTTKKDWFVYCKERLEIFERHGKSMSIFFRILSRKPRLFNDRVVHPDGRKPILGASCP